jgi:hypothetical protein
MNGHIRTATQTAIGALAVGAVLAATAASAGSSTPTRASRTGAAHADTMILAFPFKGGHQRFIDQGKKGVDAGDLFLSTGMPILDNATNARIGTGDAVELIVSRRHDGTVTNQSTLRLRGGHVELDGVVRHTDSPFRVSVIGGTGKYLGVGGQLTLLREDTKRQVVVMKLELVR